MDISLQTDILSEVRINLVVFLQLALSFSPANRVVEQNVIILLYKDVADDKKYPVCSNFNNFASIHDRNSICYFRNNP